MQKLFLALLSSSLLFLNFPIVNAQTHERDIFLVPVTSRTNPLLRLQFALENDSVMIYGTNLSALPVALKKSKFVYPKVRLNFNYTFQKAEACIENNYALQRDTSLGFRAKLTGQSYYNVMKASFLSGKGSSPIFVNQNIQLGGFPAPSNWPQNFTATVSGAGAFTVAYLPAISVSELPVLENDACEDILQTFYKLRSAQGYGMDKILYKPYNAQRRSTHTKSFDIYFESNSTQPKAAEIKAITDYLEQNRYEILHASMEGGSSVEGDEGRNKKLQQDRARIISAALSRYNKSAIKKDTILLSDNWPRFKEQIKASGYSWLDTLPRDKILQRINSDEKLKKGLEPILKTQRKASLTLTMAKVLTADDQFVTLKRSLNTWLKSQATAKQPNKDVEQQIMGAIAYLFDQHMNDVLSREEVDSLLEGDYQDHKYLYLGLHIIKQFTNNKFGPEDKSSWKTIWESLELRPWFGQAQQSLINLTERANRLDLPKYMKMQIDFQAFAFQLVNLGILETYHLCHSLYPDKPEYLSYVMNNQAFLYEMVSQTGIESECVTSRMHPTGQEWEKPIQIDSIAVNNLASDSTLASLPENIMRIGFTSRTYGRPKYDVSAKGAYYDLIKLGFLKGTKGIGSSPTDAFSLYHLLDVNITNWKPEENFFFDKEIRLEELERLIANLKKSNSICEAITSQLYLTYHMKALLYLELYFEPGSAKHKDIADGSLKFISEYYKARIDKLPENGALAIAMYLNRFNWFPGANEGARFGFDLMSTIARKRKLTEPEMRLWVNYLKVYDPELKNPLPTTNSRDLVMRANVKSY